jgi:hypothetical protein
VRETDVAANAFAANGMILPRKTDPRAIEATWRGIGNLLDRFTPAGMRANDLANPGCASV